VIVLTGAPGAGKSTVARQLADRLLPSVHLHCDDFWHYIRQGRIAPYLREAHQQNQTVIDALAHAALTYAALGPGARQHPLPARKSHQISGVSGRPAPC